MKKFVLFAAAILFAAAPALSAAEKTWNGTLSDAKCDGKHPRTSTAATTAGDHDCATKCITGWGEERVRVARQDLQDREPGLRRSQGSRRPQGRAHGRDERRHHHGLQDRDAAAGRKAK